MELKSLITDDDAVSPVIGVILMVAITVILAAVIASFVLGLGQNATDQTPTASFTFEYEQTDDQEELDGDGTNEKAGFVTVTHDGGDSISYQELYIRGSGFVSTFESSSDDSGAPGNGEPSYGDYSPPNDDLTTDEENEFVGQSQEWPESQASGDDSQVVSGDFVYVGVDSGYDISVNYEAQEGQASATLQSDTGPDA